MLTLIRSHVLTDTTANARILKFQGFPPECKSHTIIISWVQSKMPSTVELVLFCKQMTVFSSWVLMSPGCYPAHSAG